MYNNYMYLYLLARLPNFYCQLPFVIQPQILVIATFYPNLLTSWSFFLVTKLSKYLHSHFPNSHHVVISSLCSQTPKKLSKQRNPRAKKHGSLLSRPSRLLSLACSFSTPFAFVQNTYKNRELRYLETIKLATLVSFYGPN